jgi:ferredoxin-type protein NapH
MTVNSLARYSLKAKRWMVQLAASGLWNALLFPWFKALPCPALNCYGCPFAILACPIGTLQNFVVIRQVPLYTLGLLGVIGSLAGRMSCGWLCPFGFLQDLLFRLRTPKLTLSNRLGWLRYVVLALLVGLVPYLTLEPWFCKLCPAGTIQAGIPWLLLRPDLRSMIGWLFWLKIGLLLLFLAWMISTKRPFCRFICPLGAIYSPFNRVSAFQITVDKEACAECSRCQQVCPVDIRAIPEGVKGGACVRCLECVRVCPTGAIQV